jgi:hypothetical protein
MEDAARAMIIAFHNEMERDSGGKYMSFYAFQFSARQKEYREEKADHLTGSLTGRKAGSSPC